MSIKKEFWRPGNMVYPIPAVMVSLADAQGKPNIITIAWAGTVCSSPAMVSISVKPERYSHHMLLETGEFVVNLTTESLARATDYCGVVSGRDVDKFQKTGLTAGPAQTVKCPIIAECPVNIECKVRQRLQLGSHDMFVAEVTGVQVSSEYIDEKGRFCLEKTRPMTYCHGEYYGLGKWLGKFGYSVRKKEIKKQK